MREITDDMVRAGLRSYWGPTIRPAGNWMTGEFEAMKSALTAALKIRRPREAGAGVGGSHPSGEAKPAVTQTSSAPALLLSDDELLARTKAARMAAHDAPLARIYEVNKGGKPTGERHIDSHRAGWADRSRDWMELANEVDRRGLKQPTMDWDGDSRR